MRSTFKLVPTCGVSGGCIVKRKLVLSLCLLFLASLLPAPDAAALPNVVLAPESDSVYVLQGIDFSGVSGLDVTVRYDASAVSMPRVSLGALAGGALMAVNASTPGMVRLALVRVTPINGAGTIATVTFNRVVSTGNDILSVTSLALISGKNKTIPTQIVNSAKHGDDDTQSGKRPDTGTPAQPSSNSNGPGTTASTAASAGAGVLVIPVPATPDTRTAPDVPNQPPTETRQPEGDKNTAQEPDKIAVAEKPVKKEPEPEKKKVIAFQSVLEKFSEYKGEKTPQALMALFVPSGGMQEPSIALSDGKTTMKIVVELNPGGENNNFLLNGVNLVSVKNVEKTSWMVELLPDAKSTEATISIPRNNQWYVIPLTVAPTLDVTIYPAAGKLTEADFKRFLKDRGTAKAPRFDLNNDGRRDYIDDYIFTANYLAQHAAKSAGVSKVQTKTAQ
jgi:hypothetical protein